MRPTSPRGSARPSAPTTSCRPSRRAGPRWSATFARAGRAVRLRPGDHPDLRAPRGVPAGRRESPTSSARRCTTSRTRAAAASRCGPRAPPAVARAFVQHRPAAPWKVWYVAPNFRYERPQKGRYRQHCQLGAEALGVDDPDARRRGHRARPRLLPGARPARRHPELNSMGDDGRPGRATSSVLREYLARARRRAGRRRSASGSRPTRCACSTRSDPDWQDVIEHAPQITEHLSATRRGRTSRRCSAGSTGSASPTRSTRGSCAGSTTTPAPRSSSAARRSTRRRTASAAAVATTGWSRRWAGRPRRASGSASASSACCIACDAEGVVPGAATRGRRLRGRRDGQPERGHAAGHRAARGRHARRPRLRRPLDEGADEGRPTARAPGSR